MMETKLITLVVIQIAVDPFLDLTVHKHQVMELLCVPSTVEIKFVSLLKDVMMVFKMEQDVNQIVLGLYLNTLAQEVI